MGWGSPGNGLELIFTFVSSFLRLFCLIALGLFGPKVTPCRGSGKTGLWPHIFREEEGIVHVSDKNPPNPPRLLVELTDWGGGPFYFKN